MLCLLFFVLWRNFAAPQGEEHIFKRTFVQGAMLILLFLSIFTVPCSSVFEEFLNFVFRQLRDFAAFIWQKVRYSVAHWTLFAKYPSFFCKLTHLISIFYGTWQLFHLHVKSNGSLTWWRHPLCEGLWAPANCSRESWRRNSRDPFVSSPWRGRWRGTPLFCKDSSGETTPLSCATCAVSRAPVLPLLFGSGLRRPRCMFVTSKVVCG